MDRRSFLVRSLAGTSLLPGPRAHGAIPRDREWHSYAGDPHATRHSACDRITPANVRNLKVAWTHRTGDASTRPATTIECTPVMVDGVLYLTTPRVKVQALKAATGEVLWTFDPNQGQSARRSPGVNRGVTYHQQGESKRIFSVYQDRLWCLDATTGKPVPSFGKEGVIDLKENFDHDMKNLNFRHTSPVAVYQDTVITGGGGGEGPYPEAPGHIRGYDAKTGERKWIFHTIPHPGEFGHDTWEGDSWAKTGGTNCWAGMSLDTRRGIVYAGIGSPSFDYYGGNRKGNNLFGNCVLALDAKTGKRKWHFQIVHHDVWDYDMPQQPILITMRQGRRTIDAVVQCTKQGFAFFFERASGKPIWPIEERPIAPSTIDGELLSKTQPFLTKPPPLSRQGWNDDYITDISPEAHAHVKALVEKKNRGPLYTTTTQAGAVVHPGFRGGMLWGGSSFDPKRNRLFVNSDEWSNLLALEPAKDGMPFRYGLRQRDVLLDPNGYPGIKPPWGYLTAIDCDKGNFAWRIVNGEYPELKAKGIPKTGTPSHGGCISTASGLVFMAGTFDKKIRAYSSESGEILWEYELPAGGFATPCTYEADGKQFVVIAAGGGKNGFAARDEYIAFSL